MEKKIVLKSIKPEEYGDVEVTCRVIENADINAYLATIPEERRIEYELSSIKAPDEVSTVYRKGVMRGYEYSRDLVKQEINKEK